MNCIIERTEQDSKDNIKRLIKKLRIYLSNAPEYCKCKKCRPEVKTINYTWAENNNHTYNNEVIFYIPHVSNENNKKIIKWEAVKWTI